MDYGSKEHYTKKLSESLTPYAAFCGIVCGIVSSSVSNEEKLRLLENLTFAVDEVMD